ncbi:hypothetical protein [Chryseolinea sp. H1M3-3]|uniref:GTP pyrophosphokinase n=1 Tax=Chryseolinea sp. H1M3-3 TaxID=3034144 RepID=UPI0023ED7208|nr:hypothetical protein [Chryseolinea sp. H1M3-3]
MDTTGIKEFDFTAHKKWAMEEYRQVYALYSAFGGCVKSILEKSLQNAGIRYHSIEARAKDIEKFGEKASKPSLEDPNEPKYKKPLSDITDLTGARIITFFPKTVIEVDKVIKAEFEVIEKSDKNEILEKEEKLGYQSVHYLVRLMASRTGLSEYSIFKDRIAEIQVRTILQHAWAEIEHDIEYKSSSIIPKRIKRRFMALAGMLEIGDREFQSIHDENLELKLQNRESVDKGRLDKVEITADALKAYLDKEFGTDGRMTDFSYDYTASRLVQLGFKDLKEVDQCIKGYDNDKISRIIWNARQGQLSRFDDTILAALGEEIIKRHPYCATDNAHSQFWIELFQKRLSRLNENGIKTGNFKFEN